MIQKFAKASTIMLSMIVVILLLTVGLKEQLNEIILMIIMGFCFVVGMTSICITILWTGDKYIWKDHEELTECIREERAERLKAHRYIEAIKRIVANKKFATIEEINEKVEELKEKNWKP